MNAFTSAETATLRHATAPRLDLYASIHKALRHFMGDTLNRVGRLDVTDTAEMDPTLGQLDDLLEFCRSHLERENRFVHTAIEARQPGGSAAIAAEHEAHVDAIAALAADAATLRAQPDAAAAHRLYRHLARFVGENLLHMEVEESAHNRALWAAYDDRELQILHQRVLASVDAAEMKHVLRWMVPAISPAERAELFVPMQQQMPPESIRPVIESVHPHLDDLAWAKLTRALGLPPVPGLVTV